MPIDSLDEAVEVAPELTRETGLADSGRPNHRDEPDAGLALSGVEQVLQLAHLVGTPDERRLESLAAVPAAALRHHPRRAPGSDRAGLALEGQLTDGLECDRARCCPDRPLANDHGARLG